MHRAPVLTDEATWVPGDALRHRMRTATDIHRDGVFGDLFRKLQARANKA
jgi:hypothetical protein